MKPEWRSFVLPGLAAWIVALGGQWLPALAALCMLGALGNALWLFVLVVRLPFRLWRRRAVAALLCGIALSATAQYPLALVIRGVPHWVKRRAEPALQALHRWRDAHGQYPNTQLPGPDFPAELRAELEAAHCGIYRPKGVEFDLTCEGVAFTKCSFDSATGRWLGWD